MVSRTAANDLLLEFSKQLDIKPLELDADNFCALSDGEHTAMHLYFNEDKSSFLFVGLVCPMPEDEDDYAEMSRRLLTANLYFRETEGATLAIEPEEEFVVLQRYWDCSNATVEAMQEAAEQFVDLLSFWQERLASPEAEAEDSSTNTAGMMMV